MKSQLFDSILGLLRTPFPAMSPQKQWAQAEASRISQNGLRNTRNWTRWIFFLFTGGIRRAAKLGRNSFLL